MCAICAGVTVRVEGSIFLQSKTLWLWKREFVYKIITLRVQLIKLMCWETKVMAPEACQAPPGITDAYLTSKTWGPQPRSNRTGIHMGLILHTPWQMQMGTYETWGISLTDRAAGNKNIGRHRTLINQWDAELVERTRGTALQATFQVPFYKKRERPNQKAWRTTSIKTN